MTFQADGVDETIQFLAFKDHQISHRWTFYCACVWKRGGMSRTLSIKTNGLSLHQLKRRIAATIPTMTTANAGEHFAGT